MRVTWLYLIGDSHGNLTFLERALGEAAAIRESVSRPVVAVSLGDAGFWPARGGASPEDSFARILNHLSVDVSTPLLVVPGNHDYPGGGSDGELDVNGYLAWENPGLDPLRPGLTALRRGQVFEVSATAGHSVLVGGFGGAVSIDRRIRTPASSLTRGTWWPSERILESEVIAVEHSGVQVDIALTHDAPARPPGVSLWRDPRDPCLADDLEESTRLVRRVASAWRPTRLFHGHWHRRYEHTINVDGGYRLRVTGLDAESMATGTYSLDLEELVRPKG